jgi:hypothetical protein
VQTVPTTQTFTFSNTTVPPPPNPLHPDRVSTFTRGTWVQDLSGNGTQTVTFIFGLTDDQPITGDWNGDGYDKVGTVRVDPDVFAPDGKHALEFFLDYDGNRTWDSGDMTFIFGEQGDQIVVGDWTGDGKTKVGVVRPGGGGVLVWSLNRNDDPNHYVGTNYAVAFFGLTGDKLVTGDWNGDGRTKIGVARTDQSVTLPNGTHPLVWCLDTAGTGVFNGATFNFGTSIDAVIVGDWTGSGVDRVGVARRPASGTGLEASIDVNGNGAYDSSKDDYFFSQTAEQIFRGDWNATGRDRLGVALSSSASAVSFGIDLDGSQHFNAADLVFSLAGESASAVFIGRWKPIS